MRSKRYLANRKKKRSESGADDRMSSTTAISSVRVRTNINTVKRKKRERNLLDDLKSFNSEELESVTTNDLAKKIETIIDNNDNA